MNHHAEPGADARAPIATASVTNTLIPAANACTVASITAPKPSTERLQSTLNDLPLDLNQSLEQLTTKTETVLYLAYGSNLSKEKFRGSRGIKPLSQVNVQVPSLRLTFDLPGFPYSEPCMANTALRDPDNDPPRQRPNSIVSEKEMLLTGQDYRKNSWHKGLVGVVYEVTMEDYAHIIATEGGGSSYQDVLVDCYPFASDDPDVPVPQMPETRPFKAHTLFAPALPPGAEPPRDGGILQRPDTSYAQPSARYLKLLTDGATELSLPSEYQAYLHSIRPYRITTIRQRLGQVTYLATWIPLIVAIFGLSRALAGQDGRIPPWLRRLTAFVVQTAWKSYDLIFRRVFGDGERTIGDTKDNAVDRPSRKWLSPWRGTRLDRQARDMEKCLPH